MALLSDIYIHVTDEQVAHEIESTSHAVEKGVDITDHVKYKPITVSLKGKIVSFENTNAADILKKIELWQRNGSIVTYSGRNYLQNLQIQSFTTTHPNTNNGGADFDMSLREVRIAQNSYTEKKAATKESAVIKKKTSSGTQQVSKGSNTKVYHITKKGDTLWTLANKTYKSLGTSVNWILSNNPNAFGEKGKANTLKVGAKLWVGNRK